MIQPLLLLLIACGDEAQDSRRPLSETDEPCQSCEPVRLETQTGGDPTGYVTCSSGVIERVAAVPVDTSQFDQTGDLCERHYSEWGGTCVTNADCGDAARDRCVHHSGESFDWCDCVTLCSRDSDCDDGEICLSPAVRLDAVHWPTCVRADCETGADCPSGECGVLHSTDYYGHHHYSLGCIPVG